MGLSTTPEKIFENEEGFQYIFVFLEGRGKRVSL
jgi:hypothetical protein